ncbi:MAG TPA: endolytic transglycosylase MltG [Bacteroidales bacterium]|nr:endolytic transglycosylase MltG [Bacteroidales bacterium]
MERRTPKGFLNGKTLIIAVVAIAFVVLVIVTARYYARIFAPNVNTEEVQPADLYIYTGSTLDDVVQTLRDSNLIRNTDSFIWLARRKNYDNHVNPGHYVIDPGMNNNELINLLRSGKQTPVNVTFTNVRTLPVLASVVSGQLEADSASIEGLLNDERFLSSLGMNRYTIPGLFIPNTYEFYWNTGARGFVERMKKEYDRFWKGSRMKKAEKIDLTPVEVSTLASIVDEETNMTDEMPRIAGVYINRIKRGIPLQADPTIRFAMGDFTIRRVLKKQLEIDSPYNTYKFAGLPPGPIRIPSIVAIDAVLNYEHHNYYYFCAKNDFSGYHAFARTLAQHNQNARLYQKALNRRKILK